MNSEELKVGDICRTNCTHPGAWVKITKITHSFLSEDMKIADVEFLENHPYGYKSGEVGLYLLKDLVKVDYANGMIKTVPIDLIIHFRNHQSIPDNAECLQMVALIPTYKVETINGRFELNMIHYRISPTGEFWGGYLDELNRVYFYVNLAKD